MLDELAPPLNTILPPVEVTVMSPLPTSPFGCPMREPAAVLEFNVILPPAVTLSMADCGVADDALEPRAAPLPDEAPPLSVIAPVADSVRFVDASLLPPMRAPAEPLLPALVLPVIVRLPLIVMFCVAATIEDELSTPPPAPVICNVPVVRSWVPLVASMRARLPEPAAPPLAPPVMVSAGELMIF